MLDEWLASFYAVCPPATASPRLFGSSGLFFARYLCNSVFIAWRGSNTHCSSSYITDRLSVGGRRPAVNFVYGTAEMGLNARKILCYRIVQRRPSGDLPY